MVSPSPADGEPISKAALIRWVAFRMCGGAAVSKYDPLHNSRRAHSAIRAMFAMYGTVCHLCGHEGASEADLLIPRAVAPDQPIHPGAYRPAHGGGPRRCPTCGQACNQKRGSRPVMSMWSPRLEW